MQQTWFEICVVEKQKYYLCDVLKLDHLIHPYLFILLLIALIQTQFKNYH